MRVPLPAQTLMCPQHLAAPGSVGGARPRVLGVQYPILKDVKLRNSKLMTATAFCPCCRRKCCISIRLRFVVARVIAIPEVLQFSWLAVYHPFSLLEAFVSTPILPPISFKFPRAFMVTVSSSTSRRQRMVARSASAALAMAACAGLVGCGVPSVADDAGSPAPSLTVIASPSPLPTLTPSPSPSPTQSPTPAPLPIPTTQAPTPEPPAPPATQESESTPEEKTEAGGGAVAPAPVPEPKQEITYYDNCTAARAAGAAPLYQGEPGYRPALDRDKDGIACEIK